MKGKKVLLLGSLAVLVLLLLFGCAPLLREEAGGGWYIKLQISATAGSKGITVSEYPVTGLQIEVRDPEDEVLQAIDWQAVEGSKSYLIPVHELGQYEIAVKHIGEKDGQTVEAMESAAFEIKRMAITVIDVVPGCIGVINVEGGEIVDPNAWLYGYWVIGSGTMAPHSEVMEIRADGTWVMWESYFATGEIEVEGTWSYEDGIFTSTSPFGTFSGPITKTSNDQYSVSDPPGFTFYRRGTEPGGWVFNQTPIPLDAAVLAEGEVAGLAMALYSFEAPTTGNYEFEFRSAGGSWDGKTYTWEYGPYVYASDQLTILSNVWDPNVPMAKILALSQGQTIYIILDGKQSGGTYGVKVSLVP
jgi:hypothetical protein